jgi:hypothetical protein
LNSTTFKNALLILQNTFGPLAQPGSAVDS